MFEEHRQHLLSEARDILDGEGLAIGCPVDNIGIGGCLTQKKGYFEDFGQLIHEGCHIALTSAFSKSTFNHRLKNIYYLLVISRYGQDLSKDFDSGRLINVLKEG